jgi:hypothetical protein
MSGGKMFAGGLPPPGSDTLIILWGDFNAPFQKVDWITSTEEPAQV